MSIDRAEAEALLDQLNAFSSYFNEMTSLTLRMNDRTLAKEFRRALAEMLLIQDERIRRVAALEYPDLFELDDAGELKGNTT